MRKIENNLRIMKWVYGTSLPFMLGPILHAFYNYYGLDVSFFYQILSVGVLSTFLFEVPTGFIADKIGYKYSIAIGVLMMSASVLMIVFWQNPIWFIVSEVLFSLGIAFKSGADSGLIYDSLIVLNREEEYVSVFSNIRKYIFLFAGVGSILSSILFKIDPRVPVLVNAIVMSTNIVLTLFLVEPIHTEKEDRISFRQQMKFVTTHTFKNKDILRILLVASSLYGFYRLNFNSYQPFLKAQNVDVIYFGLIFFVLNVVAFLASKYSKAVLGVVKSNFVFLFIVITASFLLLSVPILPIGIMGMMFCQFFRSLYPAISSKLINERTESSIRATMLSALSFFGNLFAAILAAIIGLYADYINTYTNNLIIATALIVLFGLLNLIRRQKKT